MESTKNKLVSIIIPCFNQAHWLGEAIESALANNPLEVIVVNDGSTDNTNVIALKYPITLIIQGNRGLSGARNRGIRASAGKYVLTLDADDKIAPSFIEETVDIDDIVGTWQQEFGDTNKLWSFMPHPSYQDFRTGNRINCCSLYLREIWEEVGGYDEKMRDGYEDWDFWIRATKEGYTITTIDKPLFFYRKHGQSMINNAAAKQQEIIKYMNEKYATK